MPSIDEILASSPLAGLRRVSASGGDRQVALVQLAESFTDLDRAPAASLVILARSASAEVSDYRLDMALRWGAIHHVAAVAAFADPPWRPTVTARDIAARADIALISVPADLEIAGLVQAIMREIGGGAERALGRAQQGLEAVLAAEAAGGGLDELRAAVSQALGTPIEFRPRAGDGASGAAAADDAAARSAANGGPGSPYPAGLPGARGAAPGRPAAEVAAPIVVGETPAGCLVAPDAHGDFGVAVRLVLHTAALAAGRLLDLARRAHEMPVRSRSELLAELLMSDTAINEDLLERARALTIPVTGWHVVVRIEADDLDESGRDEVQRFELLEAAGQAALQAAAATGGTWYLTRIARAIVLVRVTTSNPGPQAGARAARSAERALQAIGSRLPSVRFRAGVGAPHEGPTGMRASAAEARGALLAARAALKPAGVAAHDAVGVRRMLMEWYASDTARASVRDQLAPLENLGPARAETAIRTLAAYLDEQGSIIRTAQKLHLHRNAVANRLRGITELLEMDLDDPDQRLALQLACRARLLD
ncbi:MAG TPA: helix-turn-helix domain-containing protein [Streptosporangiaceae bacterium]|jgi:sugar diacid utilization regulator|nr:helix-turn-helix domain-containing protein [Streptosporangiaceae bacterium]